MGEDGRILVIFLALDISQYLIQGSHLPCHQDMKQIFELVPHNGIYTTEIASGIQKYTSENTYYRGRDF